MASAIILHSEEQFLCSICLDVFTDPITTPCGHNYCKTCITHHWDSTDVCKCPLCNKTFYRRPEFSVNKVLSEMADQFRKSKQLKETSSINQEPAKPHEVNCDVCTETKIKAQKSCLVCQTSYCKTHLKPHQKRKALKRHKLINPVKNLEDYMCKKHDKPLELFCKTDHMYVCQFCTESGHKFHEVVSLKEEYEGKKAELEKTEAEVQQMIQERQEKIREVVLSKKVADRDIADTCVAVFNSLISIIERSRAELINVIEEKQKTTEIQAEGFMKELEQEITELKKRSSELRQLSHTEDHLHLLQNFTSINSPPPTKDWTKVNVHQSSYVGTVRTAVAKLEITLYQEMKKLCDVEVNRIQQYAVDITLDPDTAYPYLTLSEDGKQVYNGDIENDLPDNKERFSHEHIVFGNQSFSSGRFYYEVGVAGRDWTIGVARDSINRKDRSLLWCPRNGYWTMSLTDNTYQPNDDEAGDESETDLLLLPVREDPHIVGVFVDYEEGLVSFYDVGHRVHLHSFTGCTFTDKLNPFFNPYADNTDDDDDCHCGVAGCRYCGGGKNVLTIRSITQMKSDDFRIVFFSEIM